MANYTTDRVPSPPYRENELTPEVLGTSAISPWCGYNSSPRQAMLTKQLGQILVVNGAEPRYLQSGLEREIGKYTFNKTFDNNSFIIKVIPKFPETLGINGGLKSPVKTVIFENAEHPDLEVDVMYLEDYFCMHHYFGFEYKYNKENLAKVKPNNRVPKGTIVADSPSVKPNGDYAYGINANVLLCSHPGGIEDGVIMSESFAKKLTTKVYETRVISFGSEVMPLNLYGDDEFYKIFPDVGEIVRPDGILFALRGFDAPLVPCDMSIKAMQKVAHFDKAQFVTPGSKVVDVTVTKGAPDSRNIEHGYTAQVEKYHDRHIAYYTEIRNTYHNLKKQNPNLKISREFHRLLVEAEAHLDPKVKLTQKRNKLQPWTVTITVCHETTAQNGFKVTDTHGGKSVTVCVKPDHEMFRDEMGNVADLIVDDNSVIKRLIKGKLHEHYIGASRRDTTTRIREMVKPYGKKIPDEVYEEVWDYLLGFYKIVSPIFYQKIGELRPNIKKHVDEVIKNGIYVYLPTNSPVGYMDVVRLLKQYYPACQSQLEFIDYLGRPKKTVNKHIIGQIYYMLLEKLGNDFSAVASARLQHYGLPSKLSTANKHDNPIKATPVRFGESEFRLFVATAGGYAAADLADRSTNIDVHNQILTNLLQAEKPTDVYSLVDRNQLPIGNGYIHRIIHHKFRTCGMDVCS